MQRSASARLSIAATVLRSLRGNRCAEALLGFRAAVAAALLVWAVILAPLAWLFG